MVLHYAKSFFFAHISPSPPLPSSSSSRDRRFVLSLIRDIFSPFSSLCPSLYLLYLILSGFFSNSVWTFAAAAAVPPSLGDRPRELIKRES